MRNSIFVKISGHWIYTQTCRHHPLNVPGNQYGFFAVDALGRVKGARRQPPRLTLHLERKHKNEPTAQFWHLNLATRQALSNVFMHTMPL